MKIHNEQLVTIIYLVSGTYLVKLVLAHNVFTVGHNHPSHETTKRCDTISFTDTQDTGVNVGRTGLQCTVSVGDSTTGIVMEMCFNIAGHDATKSADQVVDLARRCAANCVCNSLERTSEPMKLGRWRREAHTTRLTPILSTAL
jgi:hypothetical protein